jgi:hypothetical protein
MEHLDPIRSSRMSRHPETADEHPTSGLATSSRCASATPQDVFLAWLLTLPDGTDVPAAARLEVDMIDRSKSPLPALLTLRTMMVQAMTPVGLRPERRRGRRSN